MNRKKAKRIESIWKDIESSEPDVSTESLLERTSQEASRIFGHWIDNSDVCEAMVQVGHFKSALP